MHFPFPRKRRDLIALAIAVPMLTGLLFVSGLVQWSPLNCWHEDVDINSGRVRHTRFLLYCQIGERIEDTWVSQNANNPNTEVDWQRVNTFSPGVHHSPHYRYHGAIGQIKSLQIVESAIPFEPGARRRVADTLLALWQSNDSYLAADEYIREISQAAISLHEVGASEVSESDVTAI